MTAQTARGRGLRRLDRAADGRVAAPVRIVHLGLGSFFRAHAAWYTDRAPDADDWGIAAFTGRSPAAAEALASQDGLYTLLVKGPEGPRTEVISSLSAAHAADDLDALRGYLARPEVAIVTLTITEAGYAGTGAGSAPGRLVAGLAARRDAGAGPIALVSNDNLPENGAVLRRVVLTAAREADAGLPGWIEENVSFVTTMVDRITPATTDEDRATVADLTGVDDPETVPTEPFSDWVLAGDFPAGRPAWETLGARFVDDVRPFEQQKLLLLNGAHSLIAYAAPLLGHSTVAEAVADPRVRDWTEAWWDAAAPHLALAEEDAEEVLAYRRALLDRFANPGIRHLLAQIATDGSQKIPVRIVPVVRAALAAGDGSVAPGALRPIAAWLLHLRGYGAPVADAGLSEVRHLADGPVEDAVTEALAWLDLPAHLAAPLRAEVDVLAALAQDRG